MKKFLFSLIGVVFIFGCFLFVESYFFTPISKNELGVLFPNGKTRIKKKCKTNYLSWSPEGAVFDFYRYKLENVTIDKNHPKFSVGWEGVEDFKDVITSTWKPTPADSSSYKIFEFTLSVVDSNQNKCSKPFKKLLDTSGSFYSFVYVSELEQYFILFHPNNERLGEGDLYYFRRRGF